MHAEGATTVGLSPSPREVLRRPELPVAAFAALLQFLTLRPLLGPFIYADELGYVAAARYFGPGYPEVQMQSGFFHAGYGLLLSPLTVLFDEPGSFHRAATSLNGAMLVLAAVLACRLARQLYDLSDRATMLVGALFAASTSVMFSSGLVWAEATMTLLVVLMATVARRAAVHHRRIDIAWLAVIAVAAYLIHPRGIAMTAAIVVALLVLAWVGASRPTIGLAVVFIAVGFVATRQLHDLTADRLFAGSALTGTNSSFRFRIEEFILRSPGSWVRGLLGTAWYQLVASAGLAAIAAVDWFTGSRRTVRQLRSGGGGRLSGANFVGLLLFGTVVLSWLIAGTIASAEDVRIDHTVYGRYLDHIGPLGLTVGAAIVLQKGKRAARPILGAAVLMLVLGWVVTLWWGPDFYDSGRSFARVNAPVFASLERLADSNLPGVAGTVAAVGSVGFWVVMRWRPAVATVAAIAVLAPFGFITVRSEVRPHSRDTVNLQALSGATEESFSDGIVMLAEPFAFLPLYAGQYWADDVQFILATECPAHPYDGVIAAPGDARYSDHAVLFTDDRSERQLLRSPVSRERSTWSADVTVSEVPGPVVSGGLVDIEISIANTGDSPIILPGVGPRPLSLAYRILEPGVAAYDTAPLRVAVAPDTTVEPGQTLTVAASVPLVLGEEPLGAGEFEIVADLFVENLGWLHEAGCPGGLPDGGRISVVETS